MFNLALQVLYKKVYGYPMELTEYGKPFKSTYTFIEKQITHKKCYMIGDNVKTDIKGANDRKGESDIEWISIAVKTGVF